jgi:hypothetical protein
MLSKDSNISVLFQLEIQYEFQELVDIDIFMAAKKVVESLSHGDCKEALKWCNDNRSKLKKINVIKNKNNSNALGRVTLNFCCVSKSLSSLSVIITRWTLLLMLESI